MLKADDYFNMFNHEVEDMNKDSALQKLRLYKAAMEFAWDDINPEERKKSKAQMKGLIQAIQKVERKSE